MVILKPRYAARRGSNDKAQALAEASEASTWLEQAEDVENIINMLYKTFS